MSDDWPQILVAEVGPVKARYMIKAAMVAAMRLSRLTGGKEFTDRVSEAANDVYGPDATFRILHRLYLNERGKSCHK